MAMRRRDALRKRRQLATDDMQQTCQNGIGMEKRQEATENARFATCNRRHARWDSQHTRDTMRLGTCVMQHATDDSQRRTCTRRDATWARRQTTHTTRLGALGRAAGKRTRGNVQQTRSHKQQCRRRHARDNAHGTTGECATDTTPHATRNGENATDDTQRATEQHADNTCAMQWTTCST